MYSSTHTSYEYKYHKKIYTGRIHSAEAYTFDNKILDITFSLIYEAEDFRMLKEMTGSAGKRK